MSGAWYVPGGRRAVLEVDAGGNERGQLHLPELDRTEPVRELTELRALTGDPAHAHHFAGVSPDGRWLAYTSNAAGGVDFDLWVCTLDTGERRLAWASGGWAHGASGFSPDGALVSLLLPGSRPLDGDLVLVHWETGRAHRPFAHPDRAGLIGPPAWLAADGRLSPMTSRAT